jgi:hypothetical protein
MEPIIQLNSNAKLSEHLASPSEATLGHSNKLDGSHLSPHFKLGEMTKSSSHPEVYNIPSHEAIANLKRVCSWLEVLRERYGKPIIINSGYRSPKLNKKIGGVPTSNHLTGCAADIRVANMEQLIRYAAILLDYADESHQDFDELLIERNRHGAIWLHFAVRPKDNRRKVAFVNA